jgi:hypothetical protein
MPDELKPEPRADFTADFRDGEGMAREWIAGRELVAWRPGVARRRVEAISLMRRGRIWLARTRAFG